jgi:hypothetical protein
MPDDRSSLLLNIPHLTVEDRFEFDRETENPADRARRTSERLTSGQVPTDFAGRCAIGVAITHQRGSAESYLAAE